MKKNSRKIQMGKDLIDKGEMRDALKQSGYLIELRIANALRQKGYSVKTNPVYKDPLTGKPREIDLIAVKGYWIDREKNDAFVCQLLIECENNPQPIVFLHDSAKPFNFGNPTKIVHGMRQGVSCRFPEKLLNDMKISEFHHHFKGDISTQYCSFTRKGKQKSGDWMASHPDEYHSSFTKLCQVFEREIERVEKLRERKNDKLKMLNIVPTLLYMINVYQGNLCMGKLNKGRLSLKNTNVAKYSRSDYVSNHERTYVIDVISERGLSPLLTAIDSDIKHVKEYLNQNYKSIIEEYDQSG